MVTIENEDALWAKRIMRRWSKSQKVTRQRTVERVERSTDRIYTRKVRRRAVRLGNAASGGFLCVNDGPEFASQLVRGVQVARRAADEGACAPLPRRDQYLSGGNAAVVELGVRFVDRREGSRGVLRCLRKLYGDQIEAGEEPGLGLLVGVGRAGP